MIQEIFCDTVPAFCALIADEQGFFLRAKESQTLVCHYDQPCQRIFYRCLTRVLIRITEIPDIKTAQLSIKTSSDADVVYWR